MVLVGLKGEEKAVGGWAGHQGGFSRAWSEGRMESERMLEEMNATSLPAHSWRRFETSPR